MNPNIRRVAALIAAIVAVILAVVVLITKPADTAILLAWAAICAAAGVAILTI